MFFHYLPHFAHHDHNPTAPTYPNSPGGHPGNRWWKGIFNVYVEYTAGFSATPDDVEQACNKLASNLLRGGRHDGRQVSSATPGWTETFAIDGALTKEIKMDLARYRQPNPPMYMDA
jgi:hypothetical protein